MSDDDIEINILIPVEEEEPAVFKPDTSGGPGVTERVSESGRQVSAAAQAAWASERRQEATTALRQGAANAVSSGRDAAQRAATSHAARRAQKEAKALPGRARRGLVRGLRWTSERLARLAKRLSD